DQWDNIYIPRYLFGIFLKERINHLLKKAVENGLIQYKLLRAEVRSVNRSNDFYQLNTCSNNSEIIFNSKKIILAIGSPHKENTDSSLPVHPAYIKDLYQPGLNENISIVLEKLKNHPADRSNLLIIGTNASALEV